MELVSISARNPGPLTGKGNNTYLLIWPDGPARRASLVDAGVGHQDHLDEIAGALHARNAVLAEVLVTHAHSDHASGASAIQRRWPSAVFRKIPWPERDATYLRDWRALEDGTLVANGSHVTVHTPGHAPDHACFWDPRSRALLSGDLVIMGTTVVIPASHGGSLTAYLDSLNRVLRLDPERLLPAHGPAIDQPRALIDEYLAHRALREHQILKAVASGCETVEAVVDSIYPGLAPDLRPVARESALAHLIKLIDEGRVRQVGEEFLTIDGLTK